MCHRGIGIVAVLGIGGTDVLEVDRLLGLDVLCLEDIVDFLW